jgi:hypothetical protein
MQGREREGLEVMEANIVVSVDVKLRWVGELEMGARVVVVVWEFRPLRGRR